MVRLVILLALASLACRSLTGRWPWALLKAWAAVRPGDKLGHARTLLGVAPLASRDEIIAAHRKLIFAIHPDRGGQDALVHEANAARDLLLSALGPANRSS